MWRRGCFCWGKTGASVTVNPADWNGSGWHQVIVTGADSLGRSASVSHSLFYGAMSITAFAGPQGSIAPSGVVAVIPQSPTNFVITPDAYCHITNIVVDGLDVGITNACTFEHVTNTHSITALFAENVTANGTPEWWLAQYGWTNNFEAAATNDADHDGLLNWQEWIAGTDPTNKFSVLSVTNMFSSASGFVLRWPSGSNRIYEVDRTTNLMLSGFDVIVTNLPATPPVNVHTDGVQGLGKAFYRIKVQQR